MDFWYTHILGSIEDSTSVLTFPELYKLYGWDFLKWVNYPFGISFSVAASNEPVFWEIYYFFAFRMNSILVYNLSVILSTYLIFITAFAFIKYFIKNPLISALLAILFTYSPFVTYKAKSHPTLLQFWLVPLFILALTNAKKPLHFAYLGLFLGFIGLTSNYWGYFLLLFAFFYIIIKSLIYKKFGFVYFSKKLILSVFLMLTIFVFVIGTFLMPFIKLNYFSSKETNIVEIFSKTTVQVEEKSQIITNDSWKLEPQHAFSYKRSDPILESKRTLEDFFVFTSRPWYYFLPSVDNPFYGHLSQKVIDTLQDKWGYFWTTNYFPSEHSTSYLGWVNLMLGFIGFRYLIRKLKTDNKSFNNKNFILNLEFIILFLVCICLFILTMPPYLTINLQKIYLPSYALRFLFPTFRVLARIGQIILLIEMLFVGLGYIYLFDSLKDKLSKNRHIKLVLGLDIFISSLVLVIIFSLSFTEFYIPRKVSDISSPPEIYLYIKDNTPKDAPFVLYPHNKARTALFWMPTHQRPLVNPRDFDKPDFEFYSEDFTDRLTTCRGLLEARNLGSRYLVFFKYAKKDPDINAAIYNYFDKSALLVKNKEFSDSVLYEFRRNIDYEKERSICLNNSSEVPL